MPLNDDQREEIQRMSEEVMGIVLKVAGRRLALAPKLIGGYVGLGSPATRGFALRSPPSLWHAVITVHDMARGRRLDYIRSYNG